MGTEVLPFGRENDPGGGVCVGAVVISIPSPARDVLLLLVVERQAEGIAEGGERPLHGIGLGLLDRTLVRFSRGGPTAMASATDLSADLRISRSHPDPHPGDIVTGVLVLP